jgi:lysozyme family protein
MADFNKIYPTIVKYEGYYVNDPRDPGGETYSGVARKFNPNWKGWLIIDKYKYDNGGYIAKNTKIPSLELDNLVKEAAHTYFNNILGDKIKSDSIATIAVQVYWGTAQGIKQVVQQAAINLGANITADNVFGKKTLDAINSLNQVELYNEMKRLYIDYFTRLGKNQPQYAQGWLNRVNYVLSITDKFINDEAKSIGLLVVAAGITYFALKK